MLRAPCEVNRLFCLRYGIWGVSIRGDKSKGRNHCAAVFTSVGNTGGYDERIEHISPTRRYLAQSAIKKTHKCSSIGARESAAHVVRTPPRPLNVALGQTRLQTIEPRSRVDVLATAVNPGQQQAWRLSQVRAAPRQNVRRLPRGRRPLPSLHMTPSPAHFEQRYYSAKSSCSGLVSDSWGG